MNRASRPQVQRHPSGEAVPQIAVGSKDKPGSFPARLQSAMQEIVAVTYWFDPTPHAGPYLVTVRFSGHRIDVKGRLSAGDRFVQDETIEEVVPGSGPISLTTRVRNINPGSWVVTAHQLPSVHAAHKRRGQENITPATDQAGPTVRLWRRWAPSVESIEQVKTCVAPFARIPGIFPGIWATMVILGIAVALMLQSLVISIDHLAVGPWWVVSLSAIVAGIVGAKGWYLVLYRHEHLVNGWCIQGFITGAVLAAALLLVILNIPAGVFLDATAPGLLFAMAAGTTRPSPSPCRAAQDEARWVDHRSSGSTRTCCSHHRARWVVIENGVACCIWRDEEASVSLRKSFLLALPISPAVL